MKASEKEQQEATELAGLDEEVTELTEESEALHNKIAPFQNRIYAIHQRLHEIKDRREELRLQKTLKGTPSKADWKAWLRDLAEEGRSTQALYRHVNRLLSKQFGMSQFGYSMETHEATISLKVEDNVKSEQKALRGLKLFTSIAKPHSDGFVHFQVSVPRSGEDEDWGSFVLYMSPESGHGRLVYRRYSDRVLSEFKSPEEAIKYIRKTYPYTYGSYKAKR